jgi:uncharacterized membrane protein
MSCKSFLLSLFLFVKNIHFVCLVKWLSTLFVPHLEGRVALFDPHPVTVRKKAQVDEHGHYTAKKLYNGVIALS